MARGRRAQPDAIKALKGNPGKRRLALENKRGAEAPAESAKLKLVVPDFLTAPREREIYTRVVGDYLQRRVARPVDVTAYARWAHYVHRWITAKEQLEGKSTWFKSESKHGTLLRRHPLFKDQLDLERVLQSLEDRLGLNPVARQNIIRGLAAIPPALGDLFGGEEKGDERDKPAAEQSTSAPAPSPADMPLGFMQHTGGQKLN